MCENAQWFNFYELKKAINFIKSQNPTSQFGLGFNYYSSATKKQLESLSQALALLKGKTPAYVGLRFYSNKIINEALLRGYLVHLKELPSLQGIWLSFDKTNCGNATCCELLTDFLKGNPLRLITLWLHNSPFVENPTALSQLITTGMATNPNLESLRLSLGGCKSISGPMKALFGLLGN